MTDENDVSAIRQAIIDAADAGRPVGEVTVALNTSPVSGQLYRRSLWTLVDEGLVRVGLDSRLTRVIPPGGESDD